MCEPVMCVGEWECVCVYVHNVYTLFVKAVYWCIYLHLRVNLPKCKCNLSHSSACVCTVCVPVCVCSSSCCLCNSSKHQGSALLCWINKSLTSIATRRLWNSHHRPQLSTLNSQSFSPSPTLLFSVSDYTPVKYLLISTLVIFSPFDLLLILYFWINFHCWGWRCDHSCFRATCGGEDWKKHFGFLQTT